VARRPHTPIPKYLYALFMCVSELWTLTQNTYMSRICAILTHNIRIWQVPVERIVEKWRDAPVQAPVQAPRAVIPRP